MSDPFLTVPARRMPGAPVASAPQSHFPARVRTFPSLGSNEVWTRRANAKGQERPARLARSGPRLGQRRVRVWRKSLWRG